MKFNQLITELDQQNIFNDPQSIRKGYEGWKDLSKSPEGFKKNAIRQTVSVYYLEYAFSEKINKGYLWIKCTYNSHRLKFFSIREGEQTILQGKRSEIVGYMKSSFDNVVSDYSANFIWDKESLNKITSIITSMMVNDTDRNGALSTPDNNGLKFSTNKRTNWDGKLLINMELSDKYPEGKYYFEYVDIPSGEKERIDSRFKKKSTSVKTLVFKDNTQKSGQYIISGNKFNLEDILDSIMGYKEKETVYPKTEFDSHTFSGVKKFKLDAKKDKLN